MGVGTKLLESLIHDARQHQTCLGNRSCRFIVAKVFDTGEFLPLPGFFRRRSFLPTLDDDQLWFPLTGSYEIAKPIGEYAPLEEDKNRAVVFHSSTCQFSYPFAEKIRMVIEEVLPNIKVDLIDEWERPGELIKRKGCKLAVNSKPIHTFFIETSKFKREIERAAC